MVDKTEDEYLGEYRVVEKYLEAIPALLRSYGHNVTVVTDLEGITEEIYRIQDCVIAHPTHEKLRRLMSFQKTHSYVGFILITGSGRESKEFHQLAQDCYFYK